MRVARVTAGPSVWVDRTGEVILEENGQVVLRIDDHDDAGQTTYDVRMPTTCVQFVEDASPEA